MAPASIYDALFERADTKSDAAAENAPQYEAMPRLRLRDSSMSATASENQRGNRRCQIPIAQPAARGFVQQGFCNATRWRTPGRTVTTGRRRNLILVRRIGNGSTEPYSPTDIDASVWRVEM
jgi:hypothetical protein